MFRRTLLALPLLAALTPDDWETELIYEVIEDVPFDTDADLIGVSTMGHGVIRSIDIAKEYRRRGKTVILGGYMASIMPGEAVKYCDSLIIGDAELVWQQMLSDFENGKLKKTYEKLRPTAKKHVEEAVPGIARLIEKHSAKVAA